MTMAGVRCLVYPHGSVMLTEKYLAVRGGVALAQTRDCPIESSCHSDEALSSGMSFDH